MWNNNGDELVNDAAFNGTAQRLDSLGYRYELDTFRACAHPQCSPLFPNHLQLAVNDQYTPAAEFLGEVRVDRSPHHVTYVIEDSRNHPELGVVGDHAYWVSGLARRDPGGPPGEIDATSRGFGRSDAPVSATSVGSGRLEGGNLGPLEFASRGKTWGNHPAAPRENVIDIAATNLARVSIDVERAHVACDVTLNIATDGPIDVALPGCGRAVHAEPTGPLPGLP
jgi:hypothetical protein